VSPIWDLLGRSWLMFGVICVKLEMLPFVAAASATGKPAELGTRGITLLPPATAAAAPVVDETMSCLPTAAGFTLAMRAAGEADCGTDVVAGDGCGRHASSFALVLPG